MKSLVIETVPIEDLLFWDKNPRKISRADLDRLKNQITTLGMYKPLIAVKEDGRYIVLGGNMRIRALRELGATRVQVSVVEAATEEERIRYALSDNDHAGAYEKEGLTALMSGHLAKLDDVFKDYRLELPDGRIELGELFEGVEKPAKHGKYAEYEDFELPSMSKVFQLTEDVRFDFNGPHDFPSLRSDMILDMPAPKGCWLGVRYTTQGPDDVLMKIHRAHSEVGMDWTRVVLAFYTADAAFENLWNNTVLAITAIVNRKPIGCVMPNFSPYTKDPKILRLYAMFRSRWVARYMQEAGLKVIPDFQTESGELDESLVGFPMGCPISLQAHQKEDVERADERRAQIDYMLDHHKPSRIWLYGPPDRLDLFPRLRQYNCEVIIPHYRAMLEIKKAMSRRERAERGAPTVG